jgi:ribonuclease P protein component
LERGARQALRRRERLASAAEFRRVLNTGRRLDGALFRLVAAENGRDYDRLGVAAGRNLGGAVRRNRARRLLREAFRRNKRGAANGCDLVLVAKPELVARTLEEIEREFRERLRRLHGTAPRRRGTPAPVDD